jgi:hypothetical protein
MNSTLKKMKFILMLALIISIPMSGCEQNEENAEDNLPLTAEAGQEPGYNSNMFIHLDTIPAEELSDAEKEGLLFLREEEKLARDVYTTLYDIFPLRPFMNISKSEQQHMNAIKYLLDRYQLDDPAADSETGVFKNTELQELYNTLIQSGKESEIEALKVGALIEEKDILDLKVELEENIDNRDIAFVYENLINGSMNHLRAFTGVLSRYGVIYIPEILEQSYYDSIINR